jgi:putative exosortase-associated protein (TIGR04073 family)
MVLAVSLLFSGTGCITSHARREDQDVSLKGTGREFARGAANVAFCWLELPSEIEARIRDDSPGDPFSIVRNVFDVTFGVVCGTIRTVERAVGGVVEIGLSPFPPYEPLMDPAYPPYLKAAKKPCAEESCGSCSSETEEEADRDKSEGDDT